jgi:hypothetical protein
MTRRVGPDGGLLLRALWNQRLPALFIIGTAVSVLLVDVMFGLARGLQGMAIGMFAFVVGLFCILLNGEYRTLRQLPTRR